MLKRFLSVLALAAVAAGAIQLSRAAAAQPATITSNEHGIKVTVTPHSFSKETPTWDFEVTLETHTRDLVDDLARSSTLIADGKRHPPINWEGARPGGHHRKGSLHFKAVTPRPAAVELQIRLGGDAAPRSFQWLLKGTGNDP